MLQERVTLYVFGEIAVHDFQEEVLKVHEEAQRRRGCMALDMSTSKVGVRLNGGVERRSCVVSFSKIVEEIQEPMHTHTNSEQHPLSCTRQHDT